MEMMMMTQYFDTMKEIGMCNGTNTVFVPSGHGAVPDGLVSTRSGIMQAEAASRKK
jgi:hypothetical protein